MVMCKYNKKSSILSFATANNPLYHIRNGELNRFKGEPMPVAIHEKMDPFALRSIEIQKGDCVYIFSDGYPDQFGGPQSKKFMSKRFRELILEITGKTMGIQYKKLDEAFENWKGAIEQIDDVVVIGVHF
jgi:serine phosphatase RsbU (regulator of sigma subunit)